jgi:chemotaxis protein MotB
MARPGSKIIIKKKKVAGGGGHHGGSWKVAYADFVTAMMAFFMVMWILGMDDKTKQAVEGYFANPVGYKKGYGAGSSPLATGASIGTVQKQSSMRLMVRSQEKQAFEEARKGIAEKLEGNDSLKALQAVVDVTIGEDGLRVELVESMRGDVYFPSGSARVNPATMLVLQLVGAELSRLRHTVVIEGHTDAAPYGSDRSYGNWELSADRANAARRALVSGGVSMEKMARVVGVSDSVLFDQENPTNPINRRISIIVMNKATEDAALGRNEAPVDDAASAEAPAEGTTEAVTEATGDSAAVPEAAPAEAPVDAPAETSTDTPPAG